MLPTKFQVNWPFGSGEDAKNRFSRWPPLWPSWISDRNDFWYLVCLIYKSPRCFLPSFKSTGLSLHEKKRKNTTATILAIFDLQKKVREKSRECHNHKPQPFPDTKRKRKQTNQNKRKSKKRTKSTKISSLFPKRANRDAKRTEKHKNKITQCKT